MKFINKIATWQNTTTPWIIIAFVFIVLVFIAHFFFQEFLYMKPCEQCVYIRFAMLIVAIGAILAMISPKNNVLKIFAYVFAFWGIWLGVEYSIVLNRIYDAVHSENPFSGIVGCKEVPVYPFNLPLYEWAPRWFLPTGECGMDMPVVPQEVYNNLNAVQKFFIGTPPKFEDGLYSNGWYLMPNTEFINMATFCLLIFIVCLVVIGAMFFSYILFQPRAKICALVVVIIVLTLKFLG
ncbi:protein-disulfide oxidoreductase DsbI [Campylobacter volucris]|uniref:Putative protein-disulfide oxidoreductase DsbI n=1 Tax=Campylobacter volucris TaxID=1031542 RepID=A0A5C7DV35_9BACT|nr:protein-disulfide oxidoreductase DsbI [Campylobacter volucris]TXE88999.1 protein-disulfide oxidoreductase DsbI [Campylobacter volucris]